MGDVSGLGSWRDGGTNPRDVGLGKEVEFSGKRVDSKCPWGMDIWVWECGGSVGDKLLALGVRLREGVRVGREGGWAGALRTRHWGPGKRDGRGEAEARWGVMS